MRRSTVAVFGTVLGTTLLIGAKLGHPTEELGLDTTATDTAPADEGTAVDGSPVTVVVSGSPTVVIPSGKPSGPGRTPSPGVTTTGPRPSPGAPMPSRTAGAPTTSPASGLKNGTYAGPGISEKYGTIKVTIVVSGGKITAASATCTNPCKGESATISDRAFNGTSSKQGLYAKTVTAQSASISSVSGATYTSNAYKQSLAAAINLAKA